MYITKNTIYLYAHYLKYKHLILRCLRIILFFLLENKFIDKPNYSILQSSNYKCATNQNYKLAFITQLHGVHPGGVLNTFEG